MYYLIFPPDSAYAIMYNVQFILFSSYEGAAAFRDKFKVKAYITDTFPVMFEAVNKDGV